MNKIVVSLALILITSFSAYGATINAEESVKMLMVVKESGTLTTGTGFFISSNGYLVTAAHVVQDAKIILFGDYDAELLYINVESDIALLKVSTNVEIDYIPVATDNAAVRGEEIRTFGFPHALGFFEIRGRVVATEIEGNGEHDKKDIYDIDVEPGMSGSPVVNANNQVIGVIQTKLGTFGSSGAILYDIHEVVKEM